MLLPCSRRRQAVVQPIRLNRQTAQRALNLLFADACGHADFGGQRVFNARQFFQAHVACRVLRRTVDIERGIRRQFGNCVENLLPRGDGTLSSASSTAVSS